MAAQPVVCPIHGTGDNTQRVPGVVAGGQAQGTFSGPTGSVVNVDGKWGASGGYTALSGSTVTNLAASLMPPKEPKKRAFGWIATFFMGYMWIGFWVLIIGAGVGGLVYEDVLLMGAGGTKPLWERAGVALFALVLALIFIGICSLGIRWYIRKQQRVRKEYPAKKRAWDQAMARWNRSYYCFRDDIVFDPDNDESCRPQDLQQFLYAHT